MSDDFPYPHFDRFCMHSLADAVAKNDYSLLSNLINTNSGRGLYYALGKFKRGRI